LLIRVLTYSLYEGYVIENRIRAPDGDFSSFYADHKFLHAPLNYSAREKRRNATEDYPP